MSTSRASLRRRGLQLVWLTIAWNVVEVFVTIGLGVAAGSIALIAFGTDSMIEVFASLVVVWHTSDLNAEIRRTRRSLQLIAVAFLILGLVLVVGAVVRLLAENVPGDSPVGVAYLAVTAVVMLRLAVLKRRTGTALGSEPLLAEAHVTFLDSALAVGVLAALALNSAFGWVVGGSGGSSSSSATRLPRSEGALERRPPDPLEEAGQNAGTQDPMVYGESSQR